MTTTITALRIPTAGNPERITLTPAADGSTLYALYAATNTSIVECFTARDGAEGTGPHVDAWMDEEGRINGSEPNFLASGVIAYLQGRINADVVALSPLFLTGGNVHFGTIVLTGYNAATGDVADLDDSVFTDIQDRLGFDIIDTSGGVAGAA